LSFILWMLAVSSRQSIHREKQRCLTRPSRTAVVPFALPGKLDLSSDPE